MRELKLNLDLEELIVSPNIAGMIPKEADQRTIAKEVQEWFTKDTESRAKWTRETDKALELAGMEKKAKNWPWPDASNVKYPLITTAAMQFAARTYPEIIRNGKVVEMAAIGKDPEGIKEARAKRLSEHMSYQLLIQNNEFEENMDRLLHMLPIVGTVFKKTYFDPVKQRNISELCLHDEIFINNDIKRIEDAQRVTHLIFMSKNDIISNIRAGIYSDIVKDDFRDDIQMDDKNKELIAVLEQHRYLDLDGDGYEEPYIVTVTRETGKILRIVARWDEDGVDFNDAGEVIRIEPVQHFTDYHFIPSPDGTYWSLGFGRLLLALNESVNTILNQLIDAGTLANMQGGFLGRGIRIKSGQIKFRPGQWNKLDSAGGAKLSDNILPFDYKEPSTVLFQLLGALIEAGKELSSVNDAMTGNEEAQNVPATTILALIEQGTKVFSSIQRRVYRALKKEFEKLYRLNRIFLDPEEYARVLDDPEAILENDYEDESMDINPVADPQMSSDAQRLARDQAIAQFIPHPETNDHEIIRRILEDLNTPNLEKILPPPDPNKPPPPEIIKMQAEIKEKEVKLEQKAEEIAQKGRDVQNRVDQAQFDMLEKYANTIKLIAEAEGVETGKQIDLYKAEIEELKVEVLKAKPAAAPASK